HGYGGHETERELLHYSHPSWMSQGRLFSCRPGAVGHVCNEDTRFAQACITPRSVTVHDGVGSHRTVSLWPAPSLDQPQQGLVSTSGISIPSLPRTFSAGIPQCVYSRP